MNKNTNTYYTTRKKHIDMINIFFLGFFLLIILLTNLFKTSNEHYYHLSRSFIQGKLYFIDPLDDMGDTIVFEDKVYWPNPPFPTFLMVPFVFTASLFGQPFYQGYLQILLLLLSGYLMYKIFGRYSTNKADTLYWLYGFVAATCFIGVAVLPWSWYFAHVVTVFLIFLALYLYFNKYPKYLIGFIYAAALLTRYTAVIGIIFFFLMELFSKATIKEKVRNILMLGAPVLLGLMIMFWYNYARYDTWQDLGYQYNNMVEAHRKAREYGTFSITHIPGNLYSLFLSSPQPIYKDGVSHVLEFPYIKRNVWGTSIFITSPIFLLMFFYKYKDRISVSIIMTVLMILIPILFYFGIGATQFGYRYSLDFLPYLYLLLVIKESERNKEMTGKIKALILLSSIFNLYLLM